MSAAANAAGYLYVHGQLPVSDLNPKAARPARTAKPQAESVKQTGIDLLCPIQCRPNSSRDGRKSIPAASTDSA